jgi:hypothetical protein
MSEEPKVLSEGPSESTASNDGEPGGLTAGMRRVLWAVGAVAAMGLAIAAWLFMTGGGSDAPKAVDTTTSPAPAPTSDSDGEADAQADADAEDGADRGPTPGATPTTGSEVRPPEATAPPTDRLPLVSAPAPRVSAPLPESGSASGELVDGFPANLMGPTAKSDVLQSSIASERDTMQVTLLARTDATPEEVRQHYRTLWIGLGLADAGGNGAASYADALSSVSLAFSSSAGTGTVYSVYGVFRTG